MKESGSFETSNSKHKLSESEESGRKEGATPKRQKLESLDSSESTSASLSLSPISWVADTNSRGAQLPNNVEGMRKIESYFSPQSDGSTPSVRQSQLRAAPDSIRDQSHPPPLQSTPSSSTTTPSHHHTERAASVVELRKANENLRIGKEQADQKVLPLPLNLSLPPSTLKQILRLETELKTSYERQRQLEDRCSRLCNTLEDMHRLLAQQEGRRRRDHLAADCVRLGKISTMRTGSALSMSPSLMWRRLWCGGGVGRGLCLERVNSQANRSLGTEG
jgi:hypothetical protein